MPDFSNFLEIQTKTAWGRTLAEFAAFCDVGPVSVILDVGTGPGLLPSIFAQAGHRSFGIDLDFFLLSSHLSANLVQADAGQLPFRPSTFDLITSVNLLFLLDEPLETLSCWRRLLKPGGWVCLLNPSERISAGAVTRLADERSLDGAARQSLLDWAHNAETHARWTEAETESLFAAAGFRLTETCLRVGPGFARLSRGVIAT
ncbi:MAG: class I SAM-dependent methyltransferase [Chloroflexota bacterium]